MNILDSINRPCSEKNESYTYYKYNTPNAILTKAEYIVKLNLRKDKKIRNLTLMTFAYPFVAESCLIYVDNARFKTSHSLIRKVQLANLLQALNIIKQHVNDDPHKESKIISSEKPKFSTSQFYF